MIKGLRKEGLQIELIVGATAGQDDTLERLEREKIKAVVKDTTKRAERYNHAFENVSCGKDDWVVLNHPRSFLEESAFPALLSVSPIHKWGAFTHQFDVHHPLLSFTSWWSNHVRGDLKKIFYLDHCLFVKRAAFEKVNGFPELEIFEDTVLSQRLAEIRSPLRLPWKSTTSSLRFIKKGIWKQALHNQIIKGKFLLGHNHQQINKSYEEGVNLNC